MKLREYVTFLRRHSVLLIVATLLGGLAGAGAWALMPSTYTARTELFVSVSAAGDPYDMPMGSSLIQDRIHTYVNMTDSAPVLQPVIDRFELRTTPGALASNVEAYSDPNTVLINVEAAEASPRAAQRMSAAVAESLVSVIGEIENPDNDESGQTRLAVSNPATAPEEADGPAGWLYAAAGLLVGFAVGLGLALMRGSLDNRLRSREDLDGLTPGAVLGLIPEEPQVRGYSLVSELRLDDTRAEAFRRLRTNLRFAQTDAPNPVVLVTSAQSKEGKSATSINLAITAAQAGSRVALVDVDLRQPAVASSLGLENSAGLTTVLLGAADVSELFQPWGTDELYVLTAGEMPPNPLELLDSRMMRTLMARLGEEFDLVILDGPPVLPVVDSLVAAQHVGQVLLVATVGDVRLNHIEEALASLRPVEIPTGIVLNKVPRSAAESYGYSARYPSRPTASREVGLTDHQLWSLASGSRPPVWTADCVHSTFPRDISATANHVRSQS